MMYKARKCFRKKGSVRLNNLTTANNPQTLYLFTISHQTAYFEVSVNPFQL